MLHVSAIRLAAVSGSFLFSTQAQCYLEDASALCAVCWQNGNPSTGRECPPGIEVVFELPKAEMYDKRPYPTNYVLKLNRTKFPIEAAKGHEIVHANIHSCVRKFGACTPFVASAPGLSTHTAAEKGNFSQFEFPSTTSQLNVGPYDLEATYTSEVKLPIEDYMIIAHLRFYTRSSNQSRVRWDVAVGSTRSILEAPVPISTDSIIAVVAAALLVMLFFGATAFGVSKGKINLEAMVAYVSGPEVSLAAELMLAILDAIAFTACVVEEVFPVNSLTHIVPTCVFLLVVVWLGSAYAVYVFLQIGMSMYHERFNQKAFVLENIEQGAMSDPDLATDDGTTSEGITSEISNRFEAMSNKRQQQVSELALQRSNILRERMRFRSALITVFLEDAPIGVINTYLLFETGAQTFVVFSLITAMILVGTKVSSLTNMATFQSRLVEANRAMTKEVSNSQLFEGHQDKANTKEEEDIYVAAGQQVMYPDHEMSITVDDQLCIHSDHSLITKIGPPDLPVTRPRSPREPTTPR